MNLRLRLARALASCLCCASFALLAGCNLVLDSLTHSCAYTEVMLPTPSRLQGAQLTVTNDAVQGVGQDANYSCLKYIGSLDHQITGPEASQTVRTWYAQQGVQLSTLPSGARFEIVRFVALIKHGFGTIDSGPGPLYMMVLKDPQGTQYYAGVAALGINLQDRFISLQLPGAAPELINHVNFVQSNDVEHPAIAFRGGDEIPKPKPMPERQPSRPMAARVDMGEQR